MRNPEKGEGSGGDFDFGEVPFSLEASQRESHPRTRRILSSIPVLIGSGICGVALVIIVIILVRFAISPEGLGERLLITDKIGCLEEVYYTRDVPEPDARRFGQFLQQVGYFTGKQNSTVQFSVEDGRWIVVLVVKPDAWDEPEVVEIFRKFRLQLAQELLHDRPVEIRLCSSQVAVGPLTQAHLSVKKVIKE